MGKIKTLWSFPGINRKRLRGFEKSRATKKTGNEALDTVRNANPRILSTSLHDMLFCEDDDAIDPKSILEADIVTPSLSMTEEGKEAYYQYVSQLGYSSHFRNNMTAKAYLYMRASQGDDRDKASLNRDMYFDVLKEESKKLYDILDPKGKMPYKIRKDKDPAESLYPVIENTQRDSNLSSFIGNEIGKDLDAFAELSPEDTIRFLVSAFAADSNEISCRASYTNGVTEDTISFDLERHVVVYKQGSVISRDPIRSKHPIIARILQSKFDIENQKDAVLLGPDLAIEDEMSAYRIIYYPERDYEKDQLSLVHEVGHCIEMRHALYYERTGKILSGYTMEDYELTKLSLVNYVDVTANVKEYFENLSERFARNLAYAFEFSKSLASGTNPKAPINR